MKVFRLKKLNFERSTAFQKYIAEALNGKVTALLARAATHGFPINLETLFRFLDSAYVGRALVQVLQLSDTYRSNAAPLIICSYIFSHLTPYLIFWTRPTGCSAE